MLTDKHTSALEKVEKALRDALHALPSVTGDTDQTSARNVLERAARLIDTHLPEIRARSVEIAPPTKPDPPAPALPTPNPEATAAAARSEAGRKAAATRAKNEQTRARSRAAKKAARTRVRNQAKARFEQAAASVKPAEKTEPARKSTETRTGNDKPAEAPKKEQS